MTAKRTTHGSKPAAKTTVKRLSLGKKTLKDITPSGAGPAGARGVPNARSNAFSCAGLC